MNLKSVSFLVFFFILRTEAKLKTGEFLALAESSGQISLIDEKTERQEILESGPVEIIVKNPNFLMNPIKYFREDKKVIIRSQNSRFKFKIPKELIANDDRISAHMRSTGQSAHLVAESEIKHVDTFQVKDKVSCTYAGTCQECSTVNGEYSCNMRWNPSCSGSQLGLIKVDVLNKTILLQIYDDKGSMVRIRTVPKESYKKTLLERITNCG